MLAELLRTLVRSVRSVRILFDNRKLDLIRRIANENGLMVGIRFVLQNELRRRTLVRLKVSGEEIFVRTSSPDYGVARSTLGGEFATLSNLFPPEHSGLIIDAGGYIGSAAVALSKLYPQATVVTIEPSSDNFSVLSMNVANRGSIHAINAAVVPLGVAGKVQLRNRGTGEWGFTTVEKPSDRVSAYIEDVETVSLENIMARFGFQSAMIVKMDIEGGELELFRQPGWLELTDALMVELHERIASGITELFQDVNSNRLVYKSDGEKYVSIRSSLVHSKLVDSDLRAN